MKRITTILLWSTALMTPAFGADKHGDFHTPRYGGIVQETKSGDLELVAKPEAIHVYASDHGKPMKVATATGKVTVFNGTDKAEAPLTLVGERLEAKGPFKVAAGTRVLVEVSLDGKPAVTSRFTLR